MMGYGADWQRRISSTISAVPLLLPLDHDLVCVAYGFDLYAITPATGEIQWQEHFSEPIWGGLLLDDGRLLLHLELSVVCLEAGGSEVWRYSHHEIVTDVVVRGDTLVVRDFAEQEIALDLRTGVMV